MMMLRNLLATALCLAVCGGATAVAQDSPFKIARSRVSDVDYYVTNYGIFGHNVASGAPGLSYPRGSGNTYVYGSGLWFGAMKSVNDTLRPLAFIGYNANSGASWATPGDVDPTAIDRGLYYSGDYDHATGAYTGAGRELAWPLWTPSGSTVTPRSPGVYVPNVADRTSGSGFAGPAFMPNVDEQFVVRYNDADLERYEGFGEEFGFPIGLQIQQSLYSWRTFGDYESVVVLAYEIVNVSDDTLFDCVVGQASDPDIGDAKNDRIAIYRDGNGLARAGVTTTETETSGDYAALAQILIESPSIGADGFIDNSLRPDQLAAHEIHTWRNWTLEMDPTTLAERYSWMLGPSQDADNGPGDKRTMLATRPFDMAPGDTAHFSMAFAIVQNPFGRTKGDKSPGLQSAGAGSANDLNTLISYLVEDYARGMFRPAGSSSAVQSEVGSESGMIVAPNPATSTASVTFSLGRGSDVDVAILDAMGRSVSTMSLGHVDAGSHRAAVDVSALASGTYVVVIDADGTRRSTLLTVTR
jgi:hypothetical protein